MKIQNRTDDSSFTVDVGGDESVTGLMLKIHNQLGVPSKYQKVWLVVFLVHGLSCVLLQFAYSVVVQCDSR